MSICLQRLNQRSTFTNILSCSGIFVRPFHNFGSNLLDQSCCYNDHSIIISNHPDLKQVADQMEDICEQCAQYSYLLSIPGFGPYVAARVLASIANPWRFDSSGQVIKMAGYDLGANRSGQGSDKAVPVISKRGNAELRYALYQAAHVASTRNHDFIGYFTRMLDGRQRERGIKTKMKVKLAAKMLKIAWTLMKRQEVFDPDHLNIQ